MKILITFLIAIIISSCAHVSSYSSPSVPGEVALRSNADLVNKTKLSVVKISFSDEGNSTSYCAGFVVDWAKGVALTAAHCAQWKTGWVDDLPSEVIQVDDFVGAVRVPSQYKPPLDIARGEPDIGDEVIAFGFGWGLWTAFVRTVASWDNEKELFAVDGPLAPGMSGGPVVNFKGKVVGINHASNNTIGIVVGVDRIKKFLKKVK